MKKLGKYLSIVCTICLMISPISSVNAKTNEELLEYEIIFQGIKISNK